jgi:hypothetical protein
MHVDRQLSRLNIFLLQNLDLITLFNIKEHVSLLLYNLTFNFIKVSDNRFRFYYFFDWQFFRNLELHIQFRYFFLIFHNGCLSKTWINQPKLYFWFLTKNLNITHKMAWSFRWIINFPFVRVAVVTGKYSF